MVSFNTTTAAEGEVEENEDDFSYFDVMMIGRTGLGKSTVGNKLLGIDPMTGMVVDAKDVIKLCDIENDQKPYFEVGIGVDSKTRKCKLLSNETKKNRVLDTQGFADSELTQTYGVVQGNLQSFRWILQAQRAHDLRFARVVYFIPHRGPLERADGTLQEEIKVMFNFFDKQIFDVMVIVVTNNSGDRYQSVGFSEDDVTVTEKGFMSAFRAVTKTDLPKCPPVVYIPFKEGHKEVMEKIVGADVISDAEMLCFSPEYPKVRSCNDDKNIPLVSAIADLSIEEKQEIFRKYRRKPFRFENRCTRCALGIVQEKLPNSEQLIPVRVVYRNGDEEQYHNSYCHPCFIPKYSQLVKFVGGVAHIVTFGLGKVYEVALKRKSWPGFGNSEEKCVACGSSPGTDGCRPVNQYCDIKIDGKDFKIKLDHSKDLDILQILVETENN